MSKAITDADFESEVLGSSLPIVVDFWAPWCGPCKAMLPTMEELGSEYEGKVNFVKMNVDENNDVPGRFSIMSIPTFIIFKNGQPTRTFVGLKSKEEFKKEIEAAIA